MDMDADHFSFSNIPYGIATSNTHPQKSVVTRVENNVIFLSDLCAAGLLPTLSPATVKALSKVWKFSSVNGPKICSRNVVGEARTLEK